MVLLGSSFSGSTGICAKKRFRPTEFFLLKLVRPPKSANIVWDLSRIGIGYYKTKFGKRVKRTWMPAIHKLCLYSHILQQSIVFKASLDSVDEIDTHGSLDKYLIETSDNRLNSLLASSLKRIIIEKMDQNKKIGPPDLSNESIPLTIVPNEVINGKLKFYGTYPRSSYVPNINLNPAPIDATFLIKAWNNNRLNREEKIDSTETNSIDPTISIEI